jgi:PST family polysaccharide transporter
VAKTEKAVRGAAWTIGSSLIARLIGVGGTLMITRYLDPSVIGEVTSASIVVVSANLFSNFGLGNYAVARYKDGPDVTFACTVLYLALGVLALGGVLLFGHKLGGTINAPQMGQYIPGLVLATFIRRLGHMPDKVLARDLKFGAIGVSVTLGELSYAVVSVVLAMRGWGGHSVVWANVVQSVIMTGIIVSQVHWRTWLGPHKIRWKRIKDQANFGVPLGLVATAHYASTTWDNLIYSRFFGVRQMGLYNLSYGLAAMPAAQIGDQVGSVLFPSMAGVDDDAKRRALIRSIGLMGLLVFPLGLGLFAIANSLVATLLTEEWQGVAPILAALSLVTALQPIAWAAGSYLLSKGYNWALSAQEFVKLGALAGGLMLFAPYGPVWACAGVAVGNAVQAAIYFYMLTKDGVSGAKLWAVMVHPLVPCIPMVAAVFGARHGLLALGVERPVFLLVAEILVGAVVFIPSAFLLCPVIARDFWGLVMSSLGRGKSD